MIARNVATAIVVLALIAASAPAQQITTTVELGPPLVRLESAETLHVTRSAPVRLPEGESLLALPVGELGIAAADAWLELTPAEAARIVDMHSGPDTPGQAVWRLQADRETEATAWLTYPMKGLTWAVEYEAVVHEDGTLALDGALRVTNTTGRDLQDATLRGNGVETTISLANGRTVTLDQPNISGTASPDQITRSVVFDSVTWGDAPIDLLSVPTSALVHAALEPGARDTPPSAEPVEMLPAGTVRVYAAPEAGGELLFETSIPCVPRGQTLELNLGPAPGVSVSRRRASAKEVDRRYDANDKLALYDLVETWELTLHNLRETPVEMTVREHHAGAWELEESTLPDLSEAAEVLEFHLSLEPGQKRTLSFRIRHNNRQP